MSVGQPGSLNKKKTIKKNNNMIFLLTIVLLQIKSYVNNKSL